jgi:hypothetical protein
LAQADEIGVGVLVDPRTAHDELVAKGSDVRDRAAEAGQPQLEEDAKYLERRAAMISV